SLLVCLCVCCVVVCVGVWVCVLLSMYVPGYVCLCVSVCVCVCVCVYVCECVSVCVCRTHGHALYLHSPPPAIPSSLAPPPFQEGAFLLCRQARVSMATTPPPLHTHTHKE